MCGFRSLLRFVKGFRLNIRKFENSASARRHRLGENTIKRFHTSLLALMLAPLALGGCILPVGVQVASLNADGVSLMTNDKSLADHGLSTVTEQDCAIWRVINGEEVCRDYDPGDGPIMTAGAEKNDVKPAEGMPWRPVEASYPLIDADDMTIAIDTEVQGRRP